MAGNIKQSHVRCFFWDGRYVFWACNRVFHLLMIDILLKCKKLVLWILRRYMDNILNQFLKYWRLGQGGNNSSAVLICNIGFHECRRGYDWLVTRNTSYKKMEVCLIVLQLINLWTVGYLVEMRECFRSGPSWLPGLKVNPHRRSGVFHALYQLFVRNGQAGHLCIAYCSCQALCHIEGTEVPMPEFLRTRGDLDGWRIRQLSTTVTS